MSITPHQGHDDERGQESEAPYPSTHPREGGNEGLVKRLPRGAEGSGGGGGGGDGGGGGGGGRGGSGGGGGGGEAPSDSHPPGTANVPAARANTQVRRMSVQFERLLILFIFWQH